MKLSQKLVILSRQFPTNLFIKKKTKKFHIIISDLIMITRKIYLMKKVTEYFQPENPLLKTFLRIFCKRYIG